MADLIYEVKDHLARITLNRPKQLNCFSEEMIHLWTEALEDIRDRDDIYAVLLSGNGKAFCAGGDVKAMAAGDGFFESHEDISSTALARKNSLWKGIQRIPLILEEIDRPVIAKIHGPAVGAGLDMALMCDVRIASESATLSESYFNAGIVPGDGGAYFLPRLVGRDKALDLFWTTKVLKGAEAERIGLVTLCVPDEELDDYVEAYMKKLLEAPQQAMRLTKRAIYQSEQSTPPSLPGSGLLLYGNRNRVGRLPDPYGGLGGKAAPQAPEKRNAGRIMSPENSKIRTSSQPGTVRIFSFSKKFSSRKDLHQVFFMTTASTESATCSQASAQSSR